MCGGGGEQFAIGTCNKKLVRCRRAFRILLALIVLRCSVNPCCCGGCSALRLMCQPSLSVAPYSVTQALIERGMRERSAADPDGALVSIRTGDADLVQVFLVK